MDLQTKRLTKIEEAEKKVHVRESQIEEVMEEEETLMEELRKQQEDIVRQGLLGEAKPAWDAALREVVDVAFQFGSTLPEVTETIVEQLLEGAHLASEDHVAALLLVHPERHGHLYVAECTEKAETYSARLKVSPNPNQNPDPNPNPNPNPNPDPHPHPHPPEPEPEP